VPEELVVTLLTLMRGARDGVAQGAHLHTSANPPGMLERLELAEIWRPCTVKEIKAPLRRGYRMMITEKQMVDEEDVPHGG
jgi:hypothetical protein